jgi:hypothetical protein
MLPAVVAQDTLAAEDLADLAQAVRDLEHVGLAGRVSAGVGRQIGLLGRFVPAPVAGAANRAAELAMKAALHIAIRSLRGRRPRLRSRALHTAAATLSGAAGGTFGLAGLPFELPVTTIIILRGIGEIARAQGEDLATPEAALACLEVFALDHGAEDSFMESGYFAARALLAKTVTEAARYLASRTIVDETAPVLVRLLSQIAARFGLVVSQKIAAQSVPLAGAAGGAAINFAFTEHFQTLARGHFTVRRLERQYGSAVVRAEYERAAAALREGAGPTPA